MKKIVFGALFMLCSVLAMAQDGTDNTIDRGAAIMYFSGKPGITPDTARYAEIAYNKLSGELWHYNRDSLGWKRVVDISQGYGDPSGDPGVLPKLWINRNDGGLFRWTGAAWVEFAPGSDDQTAAEVPFTPASTITATDAQAAIVEALTDANAYTDALGLSDLTDHTANQDILLDGNSLSDDGTGGLSFDGGQAYITPNTNSLNSEATALTISHSSGGASEVLRLVETAIPLVKFMTYQQAEDQWAALISDAGANISYQESGGLELETIDAEPVVISTDGSARFTMSATGRATLHNYGSGSTFTTGATAVLGVDDDGNLARTTSAPGGPPTGSAGGDLTGTYPNPEIAANAVGSSEIATGAVGTDELDAAAVKTELESLTGANRLNSSAIKNVDFVNVEAYGAIPSDQTDDITAIEAALATGKNIIIGTTQADTFDISRPIVVPAGRTIRVNGYLRVMPFEKIYLDQDVDDGDLTITLPTGEVSNFSVGMWIGVCIDSGGEIQVGGTQTRFVGAAARINSIAGDILTLNQAINGWGNAIGDSSYTVAKGAHIGNISSAILIEDANGVTIDGSGVIDQDWTSKIDLEGTYPVSTSRGEEIRAQCAVSIEDSHNVTVTGVTVKNAGLHNISARGANYLSVRGVTFVNAHDKNIVSVTGGRKWTISDCRLLGSLFEDGLSFYSGPDSSAVTNVYIEGMSRHGVYLNTSTNDVALSNITIHNSKFSYTDWGENNIVSGLNISAGALTSYTLYLDGADRARISNLIIDGNNLTYSVNAQVSNSRDVVIDNFFIKDFPGTIAPVRVSASKNVTYSNGIIYNCARGHEVLSTSDSILLNNVDFIDVTLAGTQDTTRAEYISCQGLPISTYLRGIGTGGGSDWPGGYTVDVDRLQVDSTLSLRIPGGEIGDRPTGKNGDLYYNTERNLFEQFRNGAWFSLPWMPEGQTSGMPSGQVVYGGSNGGVTSSNRMTYASGTGLRLTGVDNSSSTRTLLFENQAANQVFAGYNDGRMRFGQAAYVSPIDQAGTLSLTAGGSGLLFQSERSATQSGGTGFIFRRTSTLNFGGTESVLTLDGNFTSTGFAAVRNYLTINGAIDQSGGGTGVTRGIYINNTLTSAADYRALEVATGKSFFGGEVRVTGSGGTATSVTGRDADGDITSVTIGSGLSLSSGTLASTATDDQTAAEVNIADAGSHFTGTTAEAALQETGLSQWFPSDADTLVFAKKENFIGSDGGIDPTVSIYLDGSGVASGTKVYIRAVDMTTFTINTTVGNFFPISAGGGGTTSTIVLTGNQAVTLMKLGSTWQQIH